MKEQRAFYQSDTPKTEAKSYWDEMREQWACPADFARAQEREIAELVEALKVQVGYCACGGSGKRPHSWEPKEVPCQRCADAHALIAKRAQS